MAVYIQWAVHLSCKHSYQSHYAHIRFFCGLQKLRGVSDLPRGFSLVVRQPPFWDPMGSQQSHYCFCHPLFFFSSGSVGPSGDLVRVSLVRQSVKCKTSFLETSTRDPEWHSSYLLHSQDGLQANSLCVFVCVCVCLREHFSSSVDHKRMLVTEQWQPLTSIGFEWIQ